MKVLFACGGSGGHITPALAIAEILKESNPDIQCAFVGNENGMERRLAGEGGYPFYPIAIEGLHRSFTFRNLRTLLLAAKAPRCARKILKKYEPSLVIGTGGYVSYPIIPAAKRMGIPTVLYEPNAVPGLSVRLTEKYADRILLQFDACASHLKYRERTRVIGAPLRKGFRKSARNEARAALGLGQKDFIVLCFAGSLGAERISAAAVESFVRLKEKGVTLIHASGRRLYDSLRIAHPEEAERGLLLPYIDNMAAYMAAANIVVCRAGAMTLAELSRVGRTAILIPSPYVAEDHQKKNAMLYERKGAALILEEERTSSDTLTERILFLKRNPALLARMEKNASSVGSGKTDERLLLALREIIEI